MHKFRKLTDFVVETRLIVAENNLLCNLVRNLVTFGINIQFYKVRKYSEGN